MARCQFRVSAQIQPQQGQQPNDPSAVNSQQGSQPGPNPSQVGAQGQLQVGPQGQTQGQPQGGAQVQPPPGNQQQGVQPGPSPSQGSGSGPSQGVQPQQGGQTAQGSSQQPQQQPIQRGPPFQPQQESEDPQPSFGIPPFLDPTNFVGSLIGSQSPSNEQAPNGQTQQGGSMSRMFNSAVSTGEAMAEQGMHVAATAAGAIPKTFFDFFHL